MRAQTQVHRTKQATKLQKKIKSVQDHFNKSVWKKNILLFDYTASIFYAPYSISTMRSLMNRIVLFVYGTFKQELKLYLSLCQEPFLINECVEELL